MTPAPQFVHAFDPVLLEVGGVRLWYYGLAYALGFLGVHVWLMRRRAQLGWNVREVYSLSILLALSMLFVGHAFEVVVYEWSYYREVPRQILNYANGGMSTHGVLLGATLGAWVFCRLRGVALLDVADALVVPAAFFMGVGRLGNFINGENYGPVTDVWWAVKFPYAEGFRHPVDIYDAAKNFTIVLLLLYLRKKAGGVRGMLLAHFVFWYGFLRLAIDVFRDYGADFLGIGRGQYFNLAMAAGGVLLMALFRRAARRRDAAGPASPAPLGRPHPLQASPGLWLPRAAFGCILLFALTIPSGWSQGWLARLKAQHAAAERVVRRAP